MGRIVDVLGEPIPAATVQVIADGNLVQTTRSDGEGIYLIPRMPTASADLRIGAPSKAWQQLRWQGALTPVVRNVTLLDAARVHGRVTDKDGHPIAGADVIAVFGHDSVRTQTNSDGVYLLDAVAMGQVTINLWSDASPVQAKLHVRRDTECNLQTTDARGSYVQVFIKGLPDSLEDALVEVTTSNLALMPNGGRVPLTPDGLATFTVHETALVTPKVSGFSISPACQLATPGGSRLVFDAAQTNTDSNMTEVFGTVKADNRSPVRDELLRFYDRSMTLLGTAKVDRQGKFRAMVHNSSNGSYRASITLDNWAFLDDTHAVQGGHTWVTVHDGEEIELLVQATLKVYSQVQSEHGSALALAHVTIAYQDEPHGVLTSSACDPNGKLRIALPAQDYQLLAVNHDGLVCRCALSIEEGKGGRPLKWQTVPTGSVTGKLVDAQGQPMPGVQLLFAVRDIQDANLVRATHRQKVRVTTDRHGTFRCRGLPCGTWTVVATAHPDVQMVELEIKSRERLNLELAQAK